MIPLKDNLPTARFPVVTVAFIVLNVAVFIWQLSYPTDQKLDALGLGEIDQSSLEYGAIPDRITHPAEDPQCAVGALPISGSPQFEAGIVCEGSTDYTEARQRAEQSRANQTADDDLPFEALNQAPWWVTLFTSMFMHGGLLHIAGNMLFLWVFGNNIEDSMGRGRFVAFYLLAGLVAVYSQAALDPDSAIPTIGASGAVAGVLGAYALLHPKARVLTLIFIIFFVTVVEIPALVLLVIWFILQFLPAVGQVATPEVGGGGGVAYLAHVGGFLFGLAAIKLFARRSRDAEPAVGA